MLASKRHCEFIFGFSCVCSLFLYLAAAMAAATVLFLDLFFELFFVPPELQSGSFTSAWFFFFLLLYSGTWHASKHIDMEEWTLFKHVILDTNKLNKTTTAMASYAATSGTHIHYDYVFHSVNCFNVFFSTVKSRVEKKKQSIEKGKEQMRYT